MGFNGCALILILVLSIYCTGSQQDISDPVRVFNLAFVEREPWLTYSCEQVTRDSRKMKVSIFELVVGDIV